MAKRWYIIHPYSNFESKVADSIREQAKHRHLDHLFEEIMVPAEKLVGVRRGHKHEIERKFFPGLRAGQNGTHRRGLSPH
jgi:transcription termination/antitermination protein NusG